MVNDNKKKHQSSSKLCICLAGLGLLILPKLAPADYPLSALHGQILLSEVLIKQSFGNTIAENDEFIELYNAGSSVVNLSQLSLIDGNLFTNELDGTVGNITGTTRSFNFSCTGRQICEGSSLLLPKAYAVVWLGQKSAYTTAKHASFQAWLRVSPKLNDNGEDLWLYEQTASGLALVDYIAFGSGSAVNNNPPLLWGSTHHKALSKATKGQAVRLGSQSQQSSKEARRGHVNLLVPPP